MRRLKQTLGCRQSGAPGGNSKALPKVTDKANAKSSRFEIPNIFDSLEVELQETMNGDGISENS
jgi:hypothetical protein